MGRPRRISSPKKMAELWEAYKADCNNQMVLTHDFSAKNSEFVSRELRRSVTYTIEGFCVWLGISRSIFYDTYSKDERFSDIVTRIREECEVDVRQKFELSLIPPQLAPLWMGKFGYTAKPPSMKDLEEQQARIEKLRVETAKVRGEEPDDGREDDGFLDAFRGEAADIWEE